MSAHHNPPAQHRPANPGLQFERADSAGAADTGATCTACNQAIRDSYFEAAGKVVCPTCRNHLQADWNHRASQARFSKAIGLGLLAGAVGAGIYYAVAALTGYEFGLVAIVVGLLVGGAVRKGSNGLGGRRYQALAMFITYTAIVSTYIPFILEGVRESVAVQDSTATRAPAGVALVGDSLTLAAKAAGQPDAAVSTAGAAAATPNQPPGALVVVVGILVLFVLAFAAPVLAGFENIIGMLIIGIALYEAWKMNRRAELVFQGPFRITAGAPAA